MTPEGVATARCFFACVLGLLLLVGAVFVLAIPEFFLYGGDAVYLRYTNRVYVLVATCIDLAVWGPTIFAIASLARALGGRSRVPFRLTVVVGAAFVLFTRVWGLFSLMYGA